MNRVISYRLLTRYLGDFVSNAQVEAYSVLSGARTPRNMMNLRRFLPSALLTLALFSSSLSSLRANLFSVHLGRTGSNSIDIYGTVDTSTDSFTISSWTGTGTPWTPDAGEFPLTLQAYTLAGLGTSVSYDVADNWDGTMSGWAFLLPQGTGVSDLTWNQGSAIGTSSFGWGGFRGSNGFTANLGGGINSFQYIPMSNGAIDLNLTTVSIQSVPDAGSTFGLMGLALGAMALIRRRVRSA